jgi:hypothetical protein
MAEGGFLVSRQAISHKAGSRLMFKRWAGKFDGKEA